MVRRRGHERVDPRAGRVWVPEHDVAVRGRASGPADSDTLTRLRSEAGLWDEPDIDDAFPVGGYEGGWGVAELLPSDRPRPSGEVLGRAAVRAERTLRDGPAGRTGLVGENEQRYRALWAALPEPVAYDEDDDDVAPTRTEVALPGASQWATLRFGTEEASISARDGVTVTIRGVDQGAVAAFAADPETTPVGSLGRLLSLSGGEGHTEFVGDEHYQEAVLVAGEVAGLPQAAVLSADGEVFRVPLASRREWDALSGDGIGRSRVADALRARRFPTSPEGLAMVPLASPTLARAGYDPVTRRLCVQTHDGGFAVHEGVPPAAWADTREADSHDLAYQRLVQRFPVVAQSDPGPSEPASAAAEQHHCFRCGRWLGTAGTAHACPNASAGSSGDGQLASASWEEGAAILDVGDQKMWVGQVGEAEFGRLVADPDVTLHAWREGARLTARGGGAGVEPGAFEGSEPVAVEVPVEIGPSRVSVPAGSGGELEMPPVLAIRQCAARRPGKSFQIPVAASLVSGNGRRRVTGFVTVGADGRGGLRAFNEGTLTGHPTARHRVEQLVTSTLRSARAIGDFNGVRATHVAVTERLKARAEAADGPAPHRKAGPRGTSWSADPEAFDAECAAARQRKAAGEPAIPYLTENATGGLGSRIGGRGFGVEIEFDVPDGADGQAVRAAILKDLIAEGIVSEARQDDWLERDAPRRGGYRSWFCVNDDTVEGEVVSPVLYDEPQTWDQLAKVCEVLRRNGAVASVRTGNHVHVGCGDFGTSVDKHERLLRASAVFEDPLYRLAADPERGIHRGIRHCAPNAPFPVEGYTTVAELQTAQSSRTSALDFRAVSGSEKDHVEGRLWDGTLDPGVVQVHIKVTLAMVAAAAEGRTPPPEAAEPLGSHVGRAEGDEQATLGARRLLDHCFERDEDKAQAAALFAVTSWAPAPEV